MRRRRTIIATVVLAVLVLVVGGAEIAGRQVISHRIRAAVSARIGGRVDIALGSRPILVDAVSRTVPRMTIADHGASVCGLEDVALDVTLTDVRRDDGHVTVTGSRATVSLDSVALSAAMSSAMAATSGGGGSILGAATVTTDPANGTLTAALGPGGVVNVQLHPTLEKGVLELTPVSGSVAGRPLSSAVLQRLGAQPGLTRRLDALPLGMSATAVRVTDDGLSLAAAGGHGRLAAGSTSSCGGAG